MTVFLNKKYFKKYFFKLNKNTFAIKLSDIFGRTILLNRWLRIIGTYFLGEKLQSCLTGEEKKTSKV